MHSHLGEEFSGDYAINKCCQYVFGQRFVWVTDCYAIKFILSYEGGNPAILRLQMNLMCWDVDIIHRPDSKLIDANYWSCLGTDITFDPLFRKYLQLTHQLRQSKPAPMDLRMHPENMPYYRGPRFLLPTPTAESYNVLHIQGLLTDLIVSDGRGHMHLSNVPIQFGKIDSYLPTTGQPAPALLNSKFVQYARQTMNFDWAVYSFFQWAFWVYYGITNLPFTICLACDPTEHGQSLFYEFASTTTVFSSGNDLLNHIRASGD